MKVAVVGAGPHGLAAAWAAVNAGYGVDLFDRNPDATSGNPDATSGNHGVYYLEQSMGLRLPSQAISTSYLPASWSLSKAQQQYALKLYGTTHQAVSLKRESSRTVFDAKAAFDQLRFMFSGQIRQREL